ncbi:MAG: peptidylprolyl isomerase [Prochloraceae cyanobacterium]|nr:peptidylprolyl isomerase [Prochloraceae cyanobacterium]
MEFKLKIGDRIFEDRDMLSKLAGYQMIPQLAREIIIENAIAEIECTPEEEKLALQQFCQQNQIPNPEQLEVWREKNWLSPEQLQKRILLNLKISKFKQNTWGPQLESEFLQHKTRLDKVIYSLIRTKDPGIAQELYFRLLEEEDSFSDLAKNYSQGPEANTGGLVGPVEVGSLHPQLGKMLASNSPGEILSPLALGEWMVIARLDRMIPAQLDETTRQRLLQEKFQAWLVKQIQEQVSLETTEIANLSE